MVAKTLKTKPVKQTPKKKQASAKPAKEVSPAAETEDQMDVEDEQNSAGDVGPEYTIIVSNLPSTTYRSDVAAHFAPYGNIKLVLLTVPRGESVDAYIVFDTIEAANKALQLSGTKYKNNGILVAKPNDKKSVLKKQQIVQGNSSNTVFVQNLDKSTTNDKLKKFFSSCGDIQYVKILRNHATGVSKGRGFVCFQSADSVSAALKQNGSEVDGQAIAVEIYNKPETK